MSDQITIKAKQLYHGMRRRCRNDPYYLELNVQIKVSEIDFIAWATKALREFYYETPSGNPSVNRTGKIPQEGNEEGDYEIGNIEIKELWDNKVESKFLMRFLELSKNDEFRAEKIAYAVKALCKHVAINPVEISKML